MEYFPYCIATFTLVQDLDNSSTTSWDSDQQKLIGLCLSRQLKQEQAETSCFGSDNTETFLLPWQSFPRALTYAFVKHGHLKYCTITTLPSSWGSDWCTHSPSEGGRSVLHWDAARCSSPVKTSRSTCSSRTTSAPVVSLSIGTSLGFKGERKKSNQIYQVWPKKPLGNRAPVRHR